MPANQFIRRSVPFLVAGLLGIFAIVMPVFVFDLRRYEAPLFPAVRSGVEGMSWLTLFLIAASGSLVGMLFPKHPVILGASVMAGLPLLAFAEMLRNPTSHNLWPFEFLIYGLLCVPAIAGALVGRFFRERGKA